MFWNEHRIEKAAAFQYYVYLICKKLIQSRGYEKMLDIGCGPPVKVKEMFSPFDMEITLVDYPGVKHLADKYLPEAEFIGANLETIDLILSEKYNLIICADVIEHLINPGNCMQFIRNHLKPDGIAVFSTPERDFLRGTDSNHCPHKEHIREWNGCEFAKYIKSYGFHIIKHLYFPQERIQAVEYIFSLLFKRIFNKHIWASCQVVICS